MKQQAQREKERVEEGLRLSRERAAEKARVEAAALEKLNREKKELEDKKEVQYRQREVHVQYRKRLQQYRRSWRTRKRYRIVQISAYGS